jgi:hypothetical protein
MMAYLKITHITSFKELDDWMPSTRQRTVGYKTVARHDASGYPIIIRQWNTDIYTLTPDNIATLHVDGWYTVTTKQRLNDLLPMNMGIYSEKGRWFVLTRKPYPGGWPLNLTGEGEPFADGIQINVETSEIVANPNVPDWIKEDAENTRMKRKIAAYVKGLTDEKVRELYEQAKNNEVVGDCFYCLMQDVETKKPLGDETGNTEHLLSHIDEKYYMISLNLNALRAAGRGSPEFCLSSGWAVRQDVGKYLRKRLLKGVATS